MKLLITNDDGVDAEGLTALKNAAEGLGTICMIAPAGPFSGCSHRVTTDEPFRVLQRGMNDYVIEGTPADCARVGLRLTAGEPACVLSGINHGGNLGVDVHYSGTVAAVREAVMHGVPGIALSQYRRREADYDWPRATRWAAPILRDLLNRPWKPWTFWNINLPCLPAEAPDPEVFYCGLDTSPLPVSFITEGANHEHLWRYNGVYQDRKRQPGHDVDICFNGGISVTLMSL
jgi:5'-nucleotidase